jgi:hypothetical protein
MAVTQADLEKLYLAYFGRPADFDGLVYYTTGNWDIWQVAQGFSESPESQALYGPGFNAGVINNIYQNLFNRDAEPAGLLYWSQQVASGALSAAGAALGILLGAQNEDLTTVNNKLAVATAFTNALDTAAEIIGYTGADAAAAARAFLHTVTADPATVTAALAGLDAAVAAVVSVGGAIGDTVSLTKNTDTLDFTDNITVIDTVNAIVDGANSTLSVGDQIEGNGKTILSLAVASAGTSDFTLIDNVKAVNLIAATSGFVSLDATGWTNIGSVNLTSGVDGMNVFVDSLNSGAGLSIADVTGTLSTTYTDNIWTEIGATGGSGSSISYVGGVVTGTIGTNVSNIWFSQSATADGVDLTVGNITIAPGEGGGATSWAWGSVSNDQDLGGNITVGNVAISGAKYNGMFITNTDHTSASDAVNSTVGNVTISGKVAGGYVELFVENSSTGAIGTVTAGDVTLTDTGKNANVYLTLENDSWAGTNTDAMTGNIEAGNVNLTASGSGGDIWASFSQYATSTGDATAGDITINSIALAVGAKNATRTGDADVWIWNGADANGTGAATVGNISVGGQLISIAQSSTGTFTMEAWAQSSNGTATVGNVTSGDAIFNLSTDGNYEYHIYVTADAGTGVAEVGTVSTGSLTANVGIGASLTYSMDVNATGTTGTVGAVSVGSVTATVDDGGEFDLDYHVDGGTLDAVSFAGQTYTLGVKSTVTLNATLDATSEIASVTYGAIAVNAAKLTGVFHGYLNNTADTLGDVSLASVSLTAGKNADAWLYLNNSATSEWSDIAVGDVSLTGKGAGASAWFSVTANVGSNGTAGDMTVGNVTISASGGANAFAGMSAVLDETAAAGATGGTLTVGNISMSVGNAASATGADGFFRAENDLGALKVGNITLTATSARTTADTVMTYDATISLSAATSVTIGNVAVVGSTGGGANDWDVFTNVLTVTAGTTKTIGGVDYSAFTSKATIDVSGFKGAATIVGGTKADVITDNTGVNTITGGAGGDKFVFMAGNKGLTATTIDTITDFSLSQGDKITVSSGFTTPLDPNTNYAEGTFADFSAFVTGANAGNKEVYVGQIGSDSYVAIDAAGDGTVDFIVKLTGVTLSTIDVTSFV